MAPTCLGDASYLQWPWRYAKSAPESLELSVQDAELSIVMFTGYMAYPVGSENMNVMAAQPL